MKMCARWVFLFYVLYIHFETIQSNYYDSTQYSEEPEEREAMEYEDEGKFEYLPHRAKHHYKNVYAREGSEECQCSCETCKIPNPQPCCREVCYYCQQADASYPTQSPQNPKLVFVPYPVPLVVPNAYKNTTSSASDTTTNEPSTTIAATTTQAPTTTTKSALRVNSLEEMITGHHRTMKELNPGAKTKTRPAWVPKYGIVPIPDHLAAKLMSQLIETRALKDKRRF